MIGPYVYNIEDYTVDDFNNWVIYLNDSTTYEFKADTVENADGSYTQTSDDGLDYKFVLYTIDQWNGRDPITTYEGKSGSVYEFLTQFGDGISEEFNFDENDDTIFSWTEDEFGNWNVSYVNGTNWEFTVDTV